MERYKIDGNELVKFYSESTPLAQVFSDIEKDLKFNKWVVCQYIVNGKEVTEDEEMIFSEWTLAQVHTLEYLAENVGQLVVDVIQSWIETLPEFIERIENLSQNLRFEMNSKTVHQVVELIENCNYLIESVIPLKSLLGDSVAAGLGSLALAEEQTMKTLNEATHALEKKDFVLLADIIEYELIEALIRWQKGLEDLLKIIEEGKNIEPISQPNANSDKNPPGLGRKRFIN